MKRVKEESCMRSVGKAQLILVFIAIGLSIKFIFCDFGIDGEYQITMSYRLAKGDIMFKEMWEPHQTSALLCAFLIKIYMTIFKTTTGLVLFLQTVGVLLHGATSYALYRVVSKILKQPNTAFAMAWFFFLIMPKDMPLPEYANMQIWFSMLLCLCLFGHYKRKKSWLIVLACQTAHCGRHKLHFAFGSNTFPIVPYRHSPQALCGLTADCRSFV